MQDERWELSRRFLEGARKLAESSPPRHRPSPSSVARCTRQNWYSETGVPPTEPPDGESYISAESGRLTEALLGNVLNASGIARVEYLTEEERELTKTQLARMGFRGGQYDQLAFLDGVYKNRLDDGDLVLVEYKRKGAFDILDLWRKGVREAAPGDYIQMQTLMHALQMERCLYIAANWDRGALTSHGPGGRFGRKDEKGQPRYPGAYLEWVPRVALVAKLNRDRAEMQTRYILQETDGSRVPRDYNPFDGRFPCTWCPWLRQCKTDSSRGSAAVVARPTRSYTPSEAVREGRKRGAATRNGKGSPVRTAGAASGE